MELHAALDRLGDCELLIADSFEREMYTEDADARGHSFGYEATEANSDHNDRRLTARARFSCVQKFHGRNVEREDGMQGSEISKFPETVEPG